MLASREIRKGYFQQDKGKFLEIRGSCVLHLITAYTGKVFITVHRKSLESHTGEMVPFMDFYSAETRHTRKLSIGMGTQENPTIMYYDL